MDRNKTSSDTAWNTVLRAKAYTKIDKFFDLVFPLNQRSYKLVHEQIGSHFVLHSSDIHDFSKNYNFFSKKKPIISNFTPDLEAIEKTSDLLKTLVYFCKNKSFLQVSTAEILSKVIAFRNLHEGMTVTIPYVDDQGLVHIVDYTVDKIFDLWLGMPAFGLIDHKGIGAPILLYRGTDMSLHKKRGWASLFSDLDIQGPGLKAFLNARIKISSWLKQHSLSGKKVRVFGFSLGGVLCTYTILYENEYIDVAQSIAFSPPGVSSDTYSMWMKLDQNIRDSYRIFVSHGDIIPKVGKMVGKAYEHSLEFHLRPLDAHVRLMCCQPNVYQFLIDIEKENKEGR